MPAKLRGRRHLRVVKNIRHHGQQCPEYSNSQGRFTEPFYSATMPPVRMAPPAILKAAIILKASNSDLYFPRMAESDQTLIFGFPAPRESSALPEVCGYTNR